MPSRAVAVACLVFITILIIGAFARPLVRAAVFGACAVVVGGLAVVGALTTLRIASGARNVTGGAAEAGLFEQIRALPRGQNHGLTEFQKRAGRFLKGLLRTGSSRASAEMLRVALKAGPSSGPGNGDAETFTRLRELMRAAAPAPKTAESPERCEKRGRARVADLLELRGVAAIREAARGNPGFEYLDVGAAEGCITAALAADLSVPRARAYACDIIRREIADAPFQYVVANGRTLPFPDAKFGLVSMFMSAHHFTDTRAIFTEAARVAAPGAYLLLREHGRDDQAATLFYDFAHGVYETVVGTEKTPKEVESAYLNAETRPQYRAPEAWKLLAESAGFRFVESIGPRDDLFDTVYLLFRKAAASEKEASPA